MTTTRGHIELKVRTEEKDNGRGFLADPTRTESVMVVSRLHTAMQMKPVRSSFLRPARSIRKNLEGKRQTRTSALGRNSAHVHSL